MKIIDKGLYYHGNIDDSFPLLVTNKTISPKRFPNYYLVNEMLKSINDQKIQYARLREDVDNYDKKY